MASHLPLSLALTLIMLTAVGYAVATAGMKLASGGLTTAAITLIALGLLAAVLSEIVLLQQANLARIYVWVIAGETLLVLSYAAYIGDRLTMPQLSGAALVVAGLALVSH